MLAILKRELRSYFLTSSAYVYLATTFVFFGIIFLMSNVLSMMSQMGPSPVSGNFAPVFGTMRFILLFVTPILTMRLISEERRQKTDQLLHTVPISTTEIVVAKYFSAILVFALGLVISLIYPAILHFMGGVDIKPLISVYIGFFLMGAAFIAIGVFASGVTESQFIAGILGFGIILFSWFIEFVSGFFKNEFLVTVFDLVSIVKRFGDFQSGILNVSSIIYYISIIIIFVFLTIRAMDKRRWTEV